MQSWRKGASAPLLLEEAMLTKFQEGGWTRLISRQSVTHRPTMKSRWVARRVAGFTLAELITIMAIIGILAAVAVPRFFDRGDFDSRVFSDQTISALRHAQKIAVAQRRLVCVSFTVDSITFSVDSDVPADGACNPPPAGNLTGPAGQTPYLISAPNGVTLSGYVDFSFDSLGRPSAAQDITVSGSPAHIFVEAGTGYVRH